MKQLRGDPSGWDTGGESTVVAVGVFDGLHDGHRLILSEVRREAAARAAASCVLTFDPHPLRVVAPERAPAMLTTIDQRIGLLDEAGIDLVAVLPFAERVREWSPGAFVDLLADRLHAVVVVVGEDFRFGKDRSGDRDALSRLGQAAGFETLVIDLIGDDEPVSSTRIRRLVVEGDVTAAAEALGRPYELTGTVSDTGVLIVSPDAAVPGPGSYRVAVSGGDTWIETVATISDTIRLDPRPDFLPSESLRLRFSDRLD